MNPAPPYASPVYVIGRFPPPLDGQTLATRRVAELLETRREVIRVNLEPPDTGKVEEVKFRLSRVFHFIGARRRVARTLAKHPDAPVIWASISPSTLGHWRDMTIVLPTLGSKRRVVAVSHRATYDRLFTNARTEATATRLAERVDHFVFLTDSISERCAPFIDAARRSVIPNTVDDAMVASAELVSAKVARTNPRPLRILFAGHMLPEKGVFEVLSSLPLLRKLEVPFRAEFAGGWANQHDRLRFQSFVLDNDLEQHVGLHGVISDRAELARMHLEADVFVLPSYHPTEGMPLAVIEAMSAGTPLVSTRQGGLGEMVLDGSNGIIVPPRDPVAVANAFCRLAKGEVWQTLANGARHTFETRYAPDAVLERWLQVIDRPS